MPVKRPKVLERLWQLVDQAKLDDKCVEYKIHVSDKGYAYIGASRVNRLVLERKLGRSIDPGKMALHKCNNKLCINERHIYEGTASDNFWDAIADGRSIGWFSNNYPTRKER